MAEPFAPLAPEANVRFRPTEGVVDRTATTALEGLSNVLSAGKGVFDSMMEDTSTKAVRSFNTELNSINMSFREGRISETIKNNRVSTLLSKSLVDQPGLRKEFEDSATAVFGTSFKENALAKTQEDVMTSFLERGSQVAGSAAGTMTVDELMQLGSEAIRYDEELESLNKRISASKSQHELFGAVNKTNQIEVTNSARAVVSQLHKTTIGPALRQIMSGQFNSPEEAAAAKAQLAASKAQSVAQARQIFADISVAGVFLDITEQENMIKSIQTTYDSAQELLDQPAEIRKGFLEDVIVSNNLDLTKTVGITGFAARNGLLKETIGHVLDGIKLTTGQQLGPLFLGGIEEQLGLGVQQLINYKTGAAGPLSNLPANLQDAAVQMSTDLMSRPVKTERDITNFADASTQFLSDSRDFGTDNMFNLADYILDPVYVRNFKKTLEEGNSKSRQLVRLTTDYVSRLSTMLSDELSKLSNEDFVKASTSDDGTIEFTANPDKLVTNTFGNVVDLDQQQLNDLEKADRLTAAPKINRANKLLDIQNRLTKFGQAFEN